MSESKRSEHHFDLTWTGYIKSQILFMWVIPCALSPSFWKKTNDIDHISAQFLSQIRKQSLFHLMLYIVWHAKSLGSLNMLCNVFALQFQSVRVLHLGPPEDSLNPALMMKTLVPMTPAFHPWGRAAVLPKNLTAWKNHSRRERGIWRKL